MLRPLIADIVGTVEERQFFHRFKTMASTNGFTTHVANRTTFWDELAPALGHKDSAVKHALVALGASYMGYFQKRAEGRLTEDLDIFIIQQYNKSIAKLYKTAIILPASSSPDQKADLTKQASFSSTTQEFDPLGRLEVLLFCCLAFISIENLRGNYDGALTHLVNGLRIIESELPYAMVAPLRGPPGLATTPIPPEYIQPHHHNRFGVMENRNPSPFLLNLLAVFSRYEVSASLFAANIRPSIILKLFCPTSEGPVPCPNTVVQYQSGKDQGAPDCGTVSEPRHISNHPFSFPMIGPKAPLVYNNFQQAHFHFTVLAREVYALAYALQSRRGDQSFWGPSLLPSSLANQPVSGSGKSKVHNSSTPSLTPSSQASLAQYAVLKSRLVEMYDAFCPFVSGPAAPLPGTKQWQSVRLDLLHMRCCAIHLETLMFRRGAGCLANYDTQQYNFSKISSTNPPPGEKTSTNDNHACDESQDARREQVMNSLQRDFEYLINIAEEIQDADNLRRQPTNLALVYQSTSRGSTPQSSTPGTSAPSPDSTPSPISYSSVPHQQESIADSLSGNNSGSQSQLPRLTPRPPPPQAALQPLAHYAVDLGVVSPMYLAALYVKDRSLRTRALAVMRSANGIEGFWNGQILAAMLEKMFAITDDNAKDGLDPASREMSVESKITVTSKNSTDHCGMKMTRAELLDGVEQNICGGIAIPSLAERLEGLEI